jgi:hypothetical protein
MELVRIKSYNHALITLLPLYCALIEGIMLALQTVNSTLVVGSSVLTHNSVS